MIVYVLADDNIEYGIAKKLNSFIALQSFVPFLVGLGAVRYSKQQFSFVPERIPYF